MADCQISRKEERIINATNGSEVMIQPHALAWWFNSSFGASGKIKRAQACPFANSTPEESGVLTSTRPVQRQARVNHSVDVSFATVAGNAALANRTLTISLYK